MMCHHISREFWFKLVLAGFAQWIIWVPGNRVRSASVWNAVSYQIQIRSSEFSWVLVFRFISENAKVRLHEELQDAIPLFLNTGITLPQSSVASCEAVNYRGLSLAWVQRQVISSLLIVHAWWDAFLAPLFPFLPLTCDFGFRQMSNASLPPPSFVTNFAVCVGGVVVTPVPSSCKCWRMSRSF